MRREGSLLRGPGLMARKMPGVFNLYWLLAELPFPDSPRFLPTHRREAELLHDLGKLGHQTIRGIPINEWAVTHKPKEFSAWIEATYTEIAKFPIMGTIPTAQLFSAKLQKAVATLA